MVIMMKMVKKAIKLGWSIVKKNFYYIPYCITGNDYRFNVHIMSIDQTLDYMETPGRSIVRFGDGEFTLMCGGDIGHYQSADAELAKGLISILQNHNEKLLICLPEPFGGVEKYIVSSKKHWILQNKESRNIYQKLLDSDYEYGNSFVSRPYLIYNDKSKCQLWFDRIKGLFAEKNITIIEGLYSRTGVGNDLFSNVKSIERIICPPNNAYIKYNQILNIAKTIDRQRMILVALGPTGKILTAELAANGFWVLDIGHIDSEYEWFLMKATKKAIIKNKHSAEHNDDAVGECYDEEYLSSIICTIT